MNRKEKKALVEKIVGWEWIQGGSSSEASAYGQVGIDLLKLFNIEEQDEDLRRERCYEIMNLVKHKREGNPIARDYWQSPPWVPELATDSDFLVIFWEILEDIYAEHGYEELVDLIEADMKGFAEETRMKALKMYREEYDREPKDL